MCMAMSLQQLLEVFGAGDEIALAVQLEQHADLAAGVDVGADRALVGGARRLLRAEAMPRLRSTTKAFSMSPLAPAAP